MQRCAIVLVGGLALALVGCALPGSGDSGGNQDTTDPECQIQADQERGPGWPYDLALYESTVAPTLVRNCSAGGCHGGPTGAGNFTVFADTKVGNCSFAKTFNQIAAKSNLADPDNSPIIYAIAGQHPTHPYKSDGDVAMLKDYVGKAAKNANTTQAPPGASPYDYTIYQTQIQPILDTAEGSGCATANCHGGPAGAAGFKLIPTPAANSADMEKNFLAVTARMTLDNPETSSMVVKAKTRHGAGTSKIISPQQEQIFLDWAKKAKDDAGGGNGNCAPIDQFNVQVFRDEIQPILFGQVGISTGCSAGACHGLDRSGGALVLKESNTPEQNLKNFVCFVDVAQPIRSEILACPLDQAPCRHRPHPGQDVFLGANDQNFQKVLSFLYGTKSSGTPLDFAFYARVINPLLNDPASVEDGAQNRTCADTVSCHGVNAAGQIAPGGSNFPVIANLTDESSLRYNFSSATNFVNFIKPQGSSLFLYPTNEIANLNNPYATGLPHPGGTDFAVDSPEALAILQWARGLRPDNQGFVNFWLVAGDYAAAQITSPTVVDEAGVKPDIFDPSGSAAFNNGQWDALISPNRTIDLAAEFPRAANAGRVAYAVAYVLNTSSSDIVAQINVRSPDAIRVYVDNVPVAQSNDASNGVTGLATFPSFLTSKKTTRIMIKVFQPQNVQDFEFDVQLVDELGTPLTDTRGELVIKLGPDGGI